MWHLRLSPSHFSLTCYKNHGSDAYAAPLCLLVRARRRMMAHSPLLTTPASKLTPSTPLIPSKPTATLSGCRPTTRRELAVSIAKSALTFSAAMLLPVSPLLASSDEEYVKETTEVINKVRSTINMDKKDPNVASAVAELRDSSNSWVAKYRREKDLLGRPSFREMYSALNAVSGHYISFGPTAPIPAKRKARILEEVETAEKALLRGR